VHGFDRSGRQSCMLTVEHVCSGRLTSVGWVGCGVLPSARLQLLQEAEHRDVRSRALPDDHHLRVAGTDRKSNQ
jgi:hypothetical protein